MNVGEMIRSARRQSLFEAYRKWMANADQRTWEEFVRAAGEPISFALRRALDPWTRPAPDLIDDLAQETFLRLCVADGAALRNLRGNSPPELVAYLSAVAHNIACDYARRRMAAKRGKWQFETPLSIELPSQTDGVAEVEKRLLFDSVEKCLDGAQAGKRDRAIFWLYFRDGLTSRAIAQIGSLGLAQKGVESAIRQMLHNIRDCLKGKLTLNTSRGMGVETQ